MGRFVRLFMRSSFISRRMKFTLTLIAVTLTLLGSHARAADTTTQQPAAQIAPQPAQNLYAALPVPEPSQGILLMAGLMGLVVRRRRRLC